MPHASGACLILDFDGTILDTEDSSYRATAELWAAHGEELPLARWQAIIGTQNAFDPVGELEARIGRTFSATEREALRARRLALLAEQVEPRPGVVAWLDEAEQLGLPVGIASSSPAAWVERHLARLRLRERFACLACCDDQIPAKPDPTSFRTACAQLGADAARSVAVEDSPHGVAAAVAAGLYTLAVPHRLTADLDLSAANMILASLEHVRLEDVLARAAARAVSP